MDRLREIGTSIQTHIPEILEEWRSLMRQEPGLSLPKGYRLDHLRETIEHVVDVALLQPEEKEAHRAQAFAAARYGAERRAQGFPEHLVFAEYRLLERALRHFVEERFADCLQRFEAIARLDVAGGAATAAAHYGYHWEDHARRGEWPIVLEELAAKQVPPTVRRKERRAQRRNRR